jgi:hypothetical protein
MNALSTAVAWRSSAMPLVTRFVPKRLIEDFSSEEHAERGFAGNACNLREIATDPRAKIRSIEEQV